MVGKGGRQLSAGQTSASDVLVGVSWKGGVKRAVRTGTRKQKHSC